MWCYWNSFKRWKSLNELRSEMWMLPWGSKWSHFLECSYKSEWSFQECSGKRSLVTWDQLVCANCATAQCAFQLNLSCWQPIGMWFFIGNRAAALELQFTVCPVGPTFNVATVCVGAHCQCCRAFRSSLSIICASHRRLFVYFFPLWTPSSFH